MDNIIIDFNAYIAGKARDSDSAVYQYDTNRTLELVIPQDITVARVYFWTEELTQAVGVSPSSITDNTIYVTIPNSILETSGGAVKVYVSLTSGTHLRTDYEGRIPVKQRPSY